MPAPFSFHYQSVLGTDLHVIVGCLTPGLAEQAQAQVLDEILRLEAVLSTYRPDTPLSRWLRAELDELPGEVITVLALAEEWFVASEGAFNPALGRLRERWRQAEVDGRPPSPGACRELAVEAARLPFTVETSGGLRRVRRTGDCSSLDLDALAKGWIVDRAAEIVTDPKVAWLMVNVGGDLRLVGSGSVRVAVEPPTSRIDNARPLTVVTMTPGGLASSGAARRGFQVGDQWFGHVLDPRTGWPTGASAGATVIAADTVTADALATIVGVDGLEGAVAGALLARSGAAALTVSGTGSVQVSRRWREEIAADLVANG